MVLLEAPVVISLRGGMLVSGWSAVFTALLVQLDPLTGPLPTYPNVFADAVEVVGGCAAAARRRLGVLGAVSPWQLASAVTAGLLLAPASGAGRSTRADPWASRLDQGPSRFVCIHECEGGVDGVQP